MMTLVLVTDYANSYRGFSARYTSVPIPVPEPNGKSNFTRILGILHLHVGRQMFNATEEMAAFSSKQYIHREE